MVSPWMDNGDLTDYLARNDECDRLDLVSDSSQYP